MTNDEIKSCYQKCIGYIEKITNPVLRDCCQNIYNDLKVSMIHKPATSGRHHYFDGGLLYHTYCVTRNAYGIAMMYGKVDTDLILFGALLHDIGKTKEYNDFSDDEGYDARKGHSAELLGHSYEGTHIVDCYLSRYDIDEELKQQALHMIGCHMNRFGEEGSFVKTRMIETIVISFADSLDNYMEPAIRAMEGVEKGGMYEFPKAGILYFKSVNQFGYKDDPS